MNKIIGFKIYIFLIFILLRYFFFFLEITIKFIVIIKIIL